MMASGRVLIVDDDRATVEFLASALHDEGYDVLTSVDGAALGVAHDQRPDVILLDMHMPVMDGVEVSNRLRADPATAGIPIIAMTAALALRRDAARMQANDELAKPFHYGDLFAVVSRWVPKVKPR